MTTNLPVETNAGTQRAPFKKRPRIGLLALTLELYETLVPGLRASRENWLRQSVIPLLERSSEVLFDRAFFRREEIEKAVAGFEAAEADVLLVLLATYSPSTLALPALRQSRVPIVIWNTQELWAVDDTLTLDDMTNNHGVHGTQDLANVLTRAGVRFHYLTSPSGDEAGLKELDDFFAAGAAVKRLRSMRVGLMGYPFPGMGDFAVDSTYLASSLGCSWVNLTVQDYNRRCAAAPRSEVRTRADEYRRLYEVAPDVTEQDLVSAAAAELALRAMVAEHRLDALTYQFMAFGDDDQTETVPFVAMSRLMADGIGFGGEGDIVSATATAFFNRLKEPATFSEIFTIDFAGNAVLMAHMGEANVAMARRDRKVPLLARPAPIVPTRGRQLALVTSLEPGLATLAALTLVAGGKWRVIVSTGTIEDFGPRPGFCVPHFKFKPSSGDVRGFLTAYAMAGGPHHNGVLFGDARRRLSFAAGLMGAEYCEV